MSFEKQKVARYLTREQAEWRAEELNEESQSSPRGYVQYLVQPIEEPKREEQLGLPPSPHFEGS